MKKLILVLAILILPVHFLVDGFGSLMAKDGVAGMTAAATTNCTPGLDADPACPEDDPLEVSGTPDSSDYLALIPAFGDARTSGAAASQRQVPFPPSFYPLTASPPPRA